MESELLIGGILPFTALDYPNHLTAVVFCQGCPWKCRYCHNTHLQPLAPEHELTMNWEGVVEFLKGRKGLLDGVVFSGGEPIIHPKLKEAMREAKGLGFKIGLHTSGSSPAHLKKVLPEVDWVGMDIKAPFEKYEKITKAAHGGEKARECAKLIIETGVDHEFRTTVHPLLLSHEDILEMAKALFSMGAKQFALQRFQPKGCKDEALVAEGALDHFDEGLCQEIRDLFPELILR
jgi:pyruvate formate lyase activating enzyme